MDDLKPLIGALLADGKLTIKSTTHTYHITIISMTTMQSCMHPSIQRAYCRMEFDIRNEHNEVYDTFASEGIPVSCVYKAIEYVISLTKPN